MCYEKQHKIADALGVSESLLSRIKLGKRGTPPVVAKALAIMTSTNIEIWLFKTDENIKVRKTVIKKISSENLKKAILLTKAAA